MARWQGGLEKKQAFLGRLVDIGAELFAISAAVVRARMLDEDGEPAATELADLFCRQARRRVDASFAALWRNDDVRNYTAAQRVLAGRFLGRVRRAGPERRRAVPGRGPARGDLGIEARPDQRRGGLREIPAMEILGSRILLRPSDPRPGPYVYRDVLGLAIYHEFGPPGASRERCSS